MLQVAQNQDLLTEQLIARLLEDDLQDMENARAAEALQMSETLRVSALAAGRFPKKVNAVKTDPSDEDLAMEILAAEIIASKDAIIAQELQHAEESDVTASRQYAQKLAAAERKCALDAEFAKRLQDAFDDGNDDLNMDAESVLGQHTIEDIMASDLNDKGKGKGKGKGNMSVKMEVDHHAPPPSYMETIKREDSSTTLYPICGICMEPFQVTHSPVAAARSANSSSRLQFGTRLPCPRSHAYCISCLNGYIHSKLDPDGTGMVNQTAVIFPIRCPECSIAEWPEGIPDKVAGRVLSEKGMVLWHSQKLLDSGPRHYCPNPRCSALVQIDEESEDPQAVCPACTSLICVPCRVLWHTDLNCEEYQALPLDDRSPEDQDALRLIKAENWRRCPNCSFIVELTHGCNHITCRCKTEFCFKCGSLWDVRNKQCSREPSCELWDETMLLEEREREREQAGAYRGIQPVAPPARHAAPPRPVAPRRRGQSLGWMDDPDILCMRHWVTRDMISSLTCVYCDAKLNSLADLRYHLAHVRRHAVYACCGRFFKREEDFDRHVESEPVRFGSHLHTFQRD